VARHCSDQYSVLFHWYLLRDNTARLGMLHIRLCHTFLVKILMLLIDQSETDKSDSHAETAVINKNFRSF